MQTLLSAWTEKAVHNKMKKQPAIDELSQGGVTVDFNRVFGWRDQGITDPGEEPLDDVPSREWAVDRAFFMLINDDLITLDALMVSHINGPPLHHVTSFLDFVCRASRTSGSAGLRRSRPGKIPGRLKAARPPRSSSTSTRRPHTVR